MFPHYEGLGDTWRARLLGAILTLEFLLTLVLAIVFLSTEPTLSVYSWLCIASLGFDIGVWLIWHYWGINPASILLVFGSLVITSVAIFYTGGIESPGLAVQVLVVVVAGLVTTPRVTLATLLAFTLHNFSLFYFAEAQQLNSPVLSAAPLIRVSIQTAILLISAGTILYSNRILRALTQNLASSEYRFRALFEKTSDAVFIAGLDLRLIEANAQAARLLDYTPEELIGLPVKQLFPADEWQEVEKRFEAVKELVALTPTTRRFVTKTGDELMLETNLSLVLDEQGKPLHYQSTGRDVTQKVMDEQRMKTTLVDMAVKASTDSLTGILNRENILQHARAEWERYTREQRPMSLMLVDMDELKQINDTLGHHAGDQALSAVARVVDKIKRPYDWFGRYGGDEFMIVLPGTRGEDAHMIARRIDAAVKQEQVGAGEQQMNLSSSIGVASTDGHQPPLRGITELVEQADVELYKAKKRPRVVS